jgi:3-oxoacyl-(acyl-carrier-protein) synthase
VGEIDSAIAVGTDAPICPVVLAAFDVIGALSCRNDDPTRASRPFDRDRDGFVLGEGAAALCIEEREHAIARGARIYCEIDGYSSVNNRYHMSDLPDDGLALAECICIALEDAKVSPKDVAHVNAHGSSTPQNDICETNAIKRALDKHAFAITVNSLKAMTGHALGASNTIEIAACALSLYHRWHFPTMHLDNPSKGCDLDYLPYRGRRTVQGHILKLSNGFSGIHSAIVLGGAA